MDNSSHDDAVAAAAAAAAAHQLGLSDLQSQHHHNVNPHHFQLQQPDFSQNLKDDSHVDVDVHGLDIPTVDDGQHLSMQQGMDMGGEDDEGLDLGLEHSLGMTPEMDMDNNRTGSYGRPPSIRKACDLCHAAKQKCSGDRPTCTRCAAGGWQCVYAPRQRRRTVPKHEKHDKYTNMDIQRAQALSSLTATQAQAAKKRKLGQRDSLGALGTETMDMRMAMGMAMDMGLAGEDEGEEILTMSDEQMLESIAIDGYLADLPLATFVHNLPYTASQHQQDNSVGYTMDDFPSTGDGSAFPSTDMDQHTTSALRDAIFSLNESGGAGSGHDGTGLTGGEDHQNGEVQLEGDGQTLDPHLALLDLSHAMPSEDNQNTDNQDSSHTLPNLTGSYSTGCPHTPLVPHILALLTQNGLEPKPGSNTPLTLTVLAPLARSLRLFHALAVCPSCSSSPQQTLPQLALLSRTTTILTFPFPPVSSSSVGTSAQITVHGARLSGTGLSEAIEQHIVGVIWDSWRAAIREIFAVVERKAQDVITASHIGGEGGQPTQVVGSAETQRAGLMFQAMSRLVTAMDEVEGS